MLIRWYCLTIMTILPLLNLIITLTMVMMIIIIIDKVIKRVTRSSTDIMGVLLRTDETPWECIWWEAGEMENHHVLLKDSRSRSHLVHLEASYCSTWRGSLCWPTSYTGTLSGAPHGSLWLAGCQWGWTRKSNWEEVQLLCLWPGNRATLRDCLSVTILGGYF